MLRGVLAAVAGPCDGREEGRAELPDCVYRAQVYYVQRPRIVTGNMALLIMELDPARSCYLCSDQPKRSNDPWPKPTLTDLSLDMGEAGDKWTETVHRYI